MISVNHTARVMAEIEIPGSKSLTHRALIISALAEGESRIHRPLICEDTELTIKALMPLGAGIRPENGDLVVECTGGLLAETGPAIDLDNSGTSMRLLTSVAALSRGSWVLTGSDRMQARPIGPLLDSLAELAIMYADGHEELAQALRLVCVSQEMAQEMIEQFCLKAWGRIPKDWETWRNPHTDAKVVTDGPAN